MNRRAVTEFVDGPSYVGNFAMTDGPAPKRQRFGNHVDLVSVLLLVATKKELDQVQDNVMNSKLDVNSIHGQRDSIEALHKLS